MKKLTLFFAFFLFAANAFAALTPTPTSTVDTSNTEVKPGDSVNNAVRVNLVAGGAGDGAIQDGVTSTIEATVRDYTNSNPVAVVLTDANGDFAAPGAGTQYTEGDIDATITGTATMMEVAANTLQPIQGTVADGLLVNLGTNNDVTVTSGTVTANAGTGNFNVIGTKSNNGGVPSTTNLGTLPAVANASDPTQTEANQVALRVQLDGDLVTEIVDALPTGDNNIGNMDIVTMPSVTIGTFPDNEPINLAQYGGTATTLGQKAMTASIPVVLASDQSTVVVGDGAGALNTIVDSGTLTTVTTVTTVASVTTNPDVEQATASALNAEVQGDAANAAPVSGNPVLIGMRASNAIPTDVGADGDAVSVWSTRNGAQIISQPPHLGLVAGTPYSLVTETVQYTGTQTGAAVVTPTASTRLVVTKVQIQVGGTTAGTAQLWFESANGDTTYTRGTDHAIFDGEFAPSATLKPGVVMDGPWIAQGADFDLRFTDSAAINPFTITVWYYEV